MKNLKFPSPYGVSFILIKGSSKMLWEYDFNYVSVSLRSIIHSYDIKVNYDITLINKESFRLLTEYHSFLLLSNLCRQT